MTEGSPSKLRAWLKKHSETAVDESVRRLVGWGWTIVGAATLFVAYVLRGRLDDLYEVRAWWLFLPWLLATSLAAFTVVLWHRVGSSEQKRASGRRRAFQPIKLVDPHFNIAWQIKVDPAEWIDRSDAAGNAPHYIAGPYHADPDCAAELQSDGYQFQKIDSTCPRCKLLLFRRPLHHYSARPAVVRELQSMKRRGESLAGPTITLKHADYWNSGD